MSIWSSIAQDPSAWIDPQILAQMSNPGADTRDSSSGFQGSAVDQWGQPSLTVGAVTPEEMLRVGYDPRSGQDFNQWLASRGLTRMVRRVPGTNNSEVGYFDAQGNQAGQSIGRHASAENDFLAGGALMAAPALAGVIGAANAGALASQAGTAGGGLAGVDLASLPATSAGTAGAVAPSGLTAAQLDLAAGAYGPSFATAAPAAVDLGTAGGIMSTGAAAGGLSNLASSAGNALQKLATPGNLLQAATTIGGSLVGSNAINRASQIQQQATNAALAEQRRQYDQTRQDLYAARDYAQKSLLQGQGQSRQDLQAGQAQSRADLQAGQRQAADYLSSGQAQSRADLQSGLQGALGDYAPYQQAGQQALAQYQQQLNRPVTAADVMQDPGYQFGLQQGQQALDRKIAAMGGRVSGAALKAAGRYGTDYASTGYNAAYQRRQDSLNRLSQLAGMGQQAAGQSASARLGTAGSLSSGAQNAAGALSQGALGTAGALSSGALGTAGALSSGNLGTFGQLGSNEFQAAGGISNAGAQRANAIDNLVTSQGNAMGSAAMAQGNLWQGAGNQLAALYGRKKNPYVNPYDQGP
jgi:hypothetical protein